MARLTNVSDDLNNDKELKACNEKIGVDLAAEEKVRTPRAISSGDLLTRTLVKSETCSGEIVSNIIYYAGLEIMGFFHLIRFTSLIPPPPPPPP
ncbi:hypothetical protein RND71_004790 [Anisodus tanguticus]|uniref:Uncharacterized protein n=1 Tax=Anisodus tanguticus TaxID=243964 RepID=A0AAE1SMR6_9SOLA|nr:hypothetical protein RND71_004790 [Anisodus tanguticus]